MVSILNYVLLGILIYVAGIPILEELATIIVQGLEVIKGYLILKVTELQDCVNTDSQKNTSKTNAIGFTLPNDEEYEEDYDDDD